MDEASNPVHGSFLQALDMGPVKNLINPITQHLGEALGYIGDIVRFYSHQNLAKIFIKWAEAERGGKSLEEDEFKRVMPLLPLAAQVSDEELQDRWAALLESAAQGKPGFLPSFGQTLSQMTAEEARYLERIYDAVCHSHSPYYDEPMDLEYLHYVYCKLAQKVSESKTDEQLQELGGLIVEDLERLGIFEKISNPDRGRKYSLSRYGIGFVEAVSPRAAPG